MAPRAAAMQGCSRERSLLPRAGSLARAKRLRSINNNFAPSPALADLPPPEGPARARVCTLTRVSERRSSAPTQVASLLVWWPTCGCQAQQPRPRASQRAEGGGGDAQTNKCPIRLLYWPRGLARKPRAGSQRAGQIDQINWETFGAAIWKQLRVESIRKLNFVAVLDDHEEKGRRVDEPRGKFSKSNGNYKFVFLFVPSLVRVAHLHLGRRPVYQLGRQEQRKDTRRGGRNNVDELDQTSHVNCGGGGGESGRQVPLSLCRFLVGAFALAPLPNSIGIGAPAEWRRPPPPPWNE